MKLPQLKNGKWNYLAISFALPTVGMIILMMIGGYTPFGNYSMLYSDMYHQYFPFFKAYRQALLSGQPLLFNWSVGMGLDYLGLISYYLASPLNLLTVFIPENWLLPYFSLLVPIKLGLAGLFFAIFLKKAFHRDDLSLPLFGSFYALCAWALGYQWNIMWLDTFALLPLVALGTAQLLKEKKFILYTVSLFLSITANYYIGFFTCIFVLLVFLCYQICQCKSILRFLEDLGRIALFSALAIGMTAFLELPTLAALQTTHSSVNTFPENFSLNIVKYTECADAQAAWKAYKNACEAEMPAIGLWFTALWESFGPILSGMHQVAGNMGGGLIPSFKEGLPNLYCGVGTIVLAFLFLTAKQVKLREKLCSVGLLVFFMLSFIIRQLDYIWHGFHFTNMIPYRFSFLFSFVMLYMSYRAFLLRHRFRLWQVLVAGVLSIALLSLSEKRDDPVFIAYNGVFLLLYLFTWVYARYDRPKASFSEKKELADYCVSRQKRRIYSGAILAGVMAVEIILNIVNFGVNFPCTYIGGYPRGGEYTASMIRYMKEREEDNLFYRAETTHTQTLNDGALNGYNGVSTFTSSANVNVTKFIQALGYSAKNSYNRYCYEESSPVSNLFLALKYMLERQGRVEENPYFDNIHAYGNVHLLENNAYLPLGFLAQPELEDLPFVIDSSSFLFQNTLFSAATGIRDAVWSLTPPSWLSITSEDVKITPQTASGYTPYTTENANGTVKYTYQIKRDGFFCVDMVMPKNNSFTVWKNGIQLFSESLTLPQTFSVCQVKPEDVIEIKVTCKANQSSSLTVRGGVLNDSVFRRGYEILNASTLDLTHFSTTEIRGTIDCNRGGLLYTSIPQNGNWKVTVDGKPVESTLVGDAMLAVHLTEGHHEIRFHYENRAFSLGVKISLVCLLLFAGFIIIRYLPPKLRYQGKFKA